MVRYTSDHHGISKPSGKLLCSWIEPSRHAPPMKCSVWDLKLCLRMEQNRCKTGPRCFHCQAMRFTKLHQNKPQDFWNNVIWTDEPRMNLFGLNTQCHVWQKTNAAFQLNLLAPTVMHGAAGWRFGVSGVKCEAICSTSTAWLKLGHVTWQWSQTPQQIYIRTAECKHIPTSLNDLKQYCKEEWSNFLHVSHWKYLNAAKGWSTSNWIMGVLSNVHWLFCIFYYYLFVFFAFVFVMNYGMEKSYMLLFVWTYNCLIIRPSTGRFILIMFFHNESP